MKSFANWRVGVLAAILVTAAAGNASAVIRSPFPSRPTPPDHGHWVMMGSDSITAKAVTPAPAR
jgi:hypothetical protein